MDKFFRTLRQLLLKEVRVKQDMFIPQDILEINRIFKSNGYDLFIVGGAVRDTIIGHKIKDYDLATNALPDTVEQMMIKAGLRTVATGKAFGVINVFTKNDEYEIATFRIDSKESDGRRPTSVVFSDIETDVKRRDLTINALFYDIETGEIVDLVGGIDDIKNGLVRTVGHASDRFGEDKLRILRAIRFANRYGSNLDNNIVNSLKKDSSLEGISNERIRDEFLKSVKSAKSVINLIVMLNKFGLLEQIFKGLKISPFLPNEHDYVVLLASLLRNNSIEDLKKTLNKLTYSVDEVKAICFLLELRGLSPESGPILKKAQNNIKITDEQIRKSGKLSGIPSDILEKFIKFNLTVSGQEVMDEFNLSGKELGEKILQIEIGNFNKL